MDHKSYTCLATENLDKNLRGAIIYISTNSATVLKALPTGGPKTKCKFTHLKTSEIINNTC